jgi:hypothetical protein
MTTVVPAPSAVPGVLLGAEVAASLVRRDLGIAT